MAIKQNNYWQGRRVLVTGHQGFLGSWLAKTLVDGKADVVGIDKLGANKKNVILNGSLNKMTSLKGDIANLILVKKVIRRFRPQTIFHLAAEAIVTKANKNPIRTFKSNIEGTWNILEVAKNKKFIEAIVVASSDKAYGSHAKLPYKENAPLQGEHPYDVSKSCTDLLSRTYFKTFCVPVCVTRCGNIYGPGDFNFSRIVPDAVRHILQGKQFVIRSDGKFTRDYIYVQDIVEAYILLARKMAVKNLSGEAFNFSCGQPLSVLDLYKKILASCERTPIAPKILNQANGEIRHQYLSSVKARKTLGWKPRYTLKQGLQETAQWYKDHL